jgi:high-affinity iron transporter
MLASFLLSLREGLEAALIIGILLAALRKMQRSGLASAVWRGVFAAVVASLLGGLALTWVGARFEGRAEQIFEGTAMLAAAALLTWMIVWMHRQSGSIQKNLEADVQQATIGRNNRLALFWLALLAVGREGLELALFLVAAQMVSGAMQTTLGAILGLAFAITLGWVIFTSSKRLNLRQFFAVTNLLLVLFAAGVVAHGVHEFNEAGIIPPVIEHVWDLNPGLDEEQAFGQLLTALFGYNANPSLTEIAAYLFYFFGIGLLWKRFARLAYVVQTT